MRGASAAYYAAVDGNNEALKLLREYRGDITARRKREYLRLPLSPTEYSVIKNMCVSGYATIHAAAEHNHLETLKILPQGPPKSSLL